MNITHCSPTKPHNTFLFHPATHYKRNYFCDAPRTNDKSCVVKSTRKICKIDEVKNCYPFLLQDMSYVDIDKCRSTAKSVSWTPHVNKDKNCSALPLHDTLPANKDKNIDTESLFDIASEDMDKKSNVTPSIVSDIIKPKQAASSCVDSEDVGYPKKRHSITFVLADEDHPVDEETKEPRNYRAEFVETLHVLNAIQVSILRLPILLISCCSIIFSSGWVLLNGLHYSWEMSLNWVLLYTAVLVVDLVLLEPGVCLCCAVLSWVLWRRPIILDDCMSRFLVVVQDIERRTLMVDLGWAARQVTSFIHRQAAPESASLLYLLHKIYLALKKSLPNLVFITGVYWLMIYTANILVMVNLQTDMYLTNSQRGFIYQSCGLHEVSIPITVDGMWDYIENKLRPCLLGMEANVNLSTVSTNVNPKNVTINFMGSMLISPLRIKQIRVVPSTGENCTDIPLLSNLIDRERQCNFEFTKATMDRRSFSVDWRHFATAKTTNHYTHSQDKGSLLGSIDLLPHSGYKKLIFLDEDLFWPSLSLLKGTDWVDQHTRYIVVDFSLLNLYSQVASSIRLRFDIERSAPFWHCHSYHFVYSITETYVILNKIVFIVISGYGILKELHEMYLTGPYKYFKLRSNYIEIFKILLSLALCVLDIQMALSKSLLLQELKDSYVLREKSGYVDFLTVAVMDYMYTMVGGLLAMICLFQIFSMLSKIRRLAIFNRLVLEAVKLFYIPLLGGAAFGVLAFLLFSATNENFSNIETSYLMVNQYLIKPHAIYKDLTNNNPYIGPVFVFVLGVNINLFLLNVFVAFINEAYSSVRNHLRIERYKVRDKTKMEYVKEFLGIRPKGVPDDQSVDLTDRLSLQERSNDRGLLTYIKNLRTN